MEQKEERMSEEGKAGSGLCNNSNGMCNNSSSSGGSSNEICVDNSSGRMQCVHALTSSSNSGSGSRSQHSHKSARMCSEYKSGEFPDIMLYSVPSSSNSGVSKRSSGGKKSFQKRLTERRMKKANKTKENSPVLMDIDEIGCQDVKRQRVGSFVFREIPENEKERPSPEDLCVDTGSRSILETRSVKSLKKFKNLKILGKGGFGIVVTAVYHGKFFIFT